MFKRFYFITFLFITLISCNKRSVMVDYVDFVNVFVGTGGHGHTFPGATLPHGMVQLSPDTRLMGWDACAGYHYSDSVILGFSHTHLNGTGIGDYGDIMFMPVVGEKNLLIKDNSLPDYASSFSHDNECAFPGYYKVLLEDDNINVELTAAMRSGMHKYQYPVDSDARLIVDLEPTIHGHKHPVTNIKILNDSTFVGLKYTEGWAKKHYVYFYAVSSKPFDYILYSNDKKLDGESFVEGSSAKAVLTFRKNKNDDGCVMLKVGISNVDIEGAQKNLQVEIPDWDFGKIVSNAREKWNETLGKIEIETNDTKSKEIFYTSLYHVNIQPSISSDVDGRYRTMGHEIVKDSLYRNYTVFSLWDTFRALHPLLTIINPELNGEFILSLYRKYKESGLLPKWELSSNETGTMIGYHAVSVIIDAIMKEQCPIDIEKLVNACVRSSVCDTNGIHPMVNRNILYGRLMNKALRLKNEMDYIPSDMEHASVSQGLEYAYNDWLIYEALNKIKDPRADKYKILSEKYKNYFDVNTKKMRGRLSNGDWVSPFDPTSVKRPSDYVEGNAWQWSWFVPHDVESLVGLYGGVDEFTSRLDSLFTMSSKLSGDPNAAADVTGMIGQYAHGNEPSHHIPYLYNYVGQPYKTQALVDYILYNLYDNTPDGIIGNEDVGQMSAWYVLSSMGFYSFCPGKPLYEIGRPMFDQVTIHLSNGKKFIIKANNNSKENKYIRKIFLNGEEYTKYRISHFDLMDGGTLVFDMCNIQ